MSFLHEQSIELMAGPLDGLVVTFPLPLETILFVKTKNIQAHWFARFMESLKLGKTSRPFVVAIYELNVSHEQFVYNHISSQIALEQSIRDDVLWLLLNEEGTITAASRSSHRR